jgi:hypothetical protein
VSTYPPARFVGHDPLGLGHRLADGLVDRLAAGGGPQHGVDAAAATEPDTEKALQAASDLAVRQAARLVEFDDGGLGIWPELSGSSAEGVGCLQRMAALNAATAPATLTDVDVELPMNGLARDLDLELLGDMRCIERTAAVGAAVRQGRLVDLVDLLRAGRLAVGLGAVVLAGLAAGLLGLIGGLAPGEGGGLALAGAGGLVELAAEALVLGLQVEEASLKGLAAGTRDGWHTPIIGEARVAAALSRARCRDQLWLDALNKY